MESGILVGDIMTRNFIYVSLDTNLLQCAKTLLRKKVGSLIVKEKDKLEGILTQRDLLWAVLKKSRKDLKTILAKDLMKRKVVTIKPSADLAEAMRRMRKKKVRRLPVVENGKVIGMLTWKDILRIDPGLYELLTHSFKIKEQIQKRWRSHLAISRSHGICEECGERGVLFRIEGARICESCYNDR